MIEKNVENAKIQIIHGALSTEDKQKIMIDFINKNIIFWFLQP